MIGIVADDLTGANDIGLMFAKHGYKTEVYSFSTEQELDLRTIQADVLILDTNSRLLTPSMAFARVRAATERLVALRCRLLMKKSCSVLRGNVGAEFDAMLEAAGADFAVVVGAFPKNGRLTKNGLHYVHGKLLAESEFRHDPANPMHLNDLREIIALQSHRRIHLLDYRVIAQGVSTIKQQLEKFRRQGGYVVCDTTSQADLRRLAEALAAEPFLFGSSALAEELPHYWPPPPIGLTFKGLPPSKAGTLIIAGSITTETKTQIACARQNAIATAELDPRVLFSPAERHSACAHLVNWAIPLLKAGRPVLIYAAHQPEDIAATYQKAAQAGVSRLEASQTVSQTLAQISQAIIEQAKVRRLIVAGGETANDVCRQLGIVGNLILKEIQPGLPSGLTHGRHELLVVLKSGSFGSADFFLQALDHLERL